MSNATAMPYTTLTMTAEEYTKALYEIRRARRNSEHKIVRLFHALGILVSGSAGTNMIQIPQVAPKKHNGSLNFITGKFLACGAKPLNGAASATTSTVEAKEPPPKFTAKPTSDVTLPNGLQKVLEGMLEALNEISCGIRDLRNDAHALLAMQSPKQPAPATQPTGTVVKDFGPGWMSIERMTEKLNGNMRVFLDNYIGKNVGDSKTHGYRTLKSEIVRQMLSLGDKSSFHGLHKMEGDVELVHVNAVPLLEKRIRYWYTELLTCRMVKWSTTFNKDRGRNVVTSYMPRESDLRVRLRAYGISKDSVSREIAIRMGRIPTDFSNKSTES